MNTNETNITMAGGMRWVAVSDPRYGQVFRSHYREHLLRARETADFWIIGRETSRGFVFVALGQTIEKAAETAREVLA